MSDLKPSELELMQILWEHGPLKPAEIQERLGRRVKNSALRWELGRLVEKSRVVREKRGKAYFYRAKVAPRGILKTLTRALAEAFGGGSTAALIGKMIESENLSDDDIRELQRIAQRKTQKRASRRRRDGE